MNDNFNFYLSSFKDFIKHYEYYHNIISLSNNDANIDILNSIVTEIDKKILDINKKDELEKFLTEDLTKFLNEKYKLVNNENIFNASSRETYYLLFNKSFNKLKFYTKLSKKLNECNDIEELLKTEFKDHHLQNKKDIDTTKLNNILIENQFKSINIDKSADIDQIVRIIKNGAFLVEKIYGLEPQEIGGKTLSLNFTFMPFVGAAALTPSGNLISYHLESNGMLDDFAYRTFVHEYSHFLQDKKYDLKDVYNSEKQIKEDIYWNKVKEIVNSTKSSINDVIEYSLNTIEARFTKLITLTEEQTEKIKKTINDNIDSNQYSDVINKLIDDLSTNIFEISGTKYYEINEKKIPEYSIVSIKRNLNLIHNAHNSSSFLKTLWTSLDEQRNSTYLSNEFETHSRLVESLTTLSKSNDTFLFYPTKSMMEDIKKPLTIFNKTLANHYNDYTLVKKLDKKNSTEEDETKIKSKEESIDAISKYKENLSQEKTKINKTI